MTVYVDPLMDHGWMLRGRVVRSCHMFTDEVDLARLHSIATRAGCRFEWFQNCRVPHYDLTPERRRAAIAAGAIPVDRRTAVEIWRVHQRKAA